MILGRGVGGLRLRSRVRGFGLRRVGIVGYSGVVGVLGVR